MTVIDTIKSKIMGGPPWARRIGKDHYEVEPSVVYPLFLERLAMEPTQFSLEVARRCMTEELKKAVGRPFRLRIAPDPEWRLENFEPGEGAPAGAAMFRRYYPRLGAHGAIPEGR